VRGRDEDPMRWPVRWTDAPSDDALERRAGELLLLPPPAPLGAVRRARIATRLAAGSGPSAWIRVRHVVAAVVVALVVAGSVVAAVSHRGRSGAGSASSDVARPRPHARAASGSVAPPDLAPDPAPTPGQPPAIAPSLAPPAISSSLAPAPRDDAPPHVHRHPKTTAGGAMARQDLDAAPSAAGPLSEARLLAAARTRLQAEHDARGALALVAEHKQRFPTGVLVLEARITEVESLVTLGRRSEALAVLDVLSLDKLPRAAELGVLRGELRAEAGRQRDATVDFAPCADVAGCRPETAERALYGRASCRERLGDRAGARADLERYLARFPQGRFARAVRAALAAR